MFTRQKIHFSAAGIALAVILISRWIIPSQSWDLLNIIPALGTLYLVAFVVMLPGIIDVALRHVRWMRFFLSPWFRVLLIMTLLVTSIEFSLRMKSYHRTVYYERQGDLLFTPVLNQNSVEKISITPSQINNYGLRGRDITEGDLNKKVILCLGDSITYGYGVDDNHTYPAQLQRKLDQKREGLFTVLNGGVNAYPIAFMHQKFLYLWCLGIQPYAVIVGYSMNEGWLGDLVASSKERKKAFEKRVKLKNFVRSFALYNLVVENWARAYYDKIKAKLIPGTHRTEEEHVDRDMTYEKSLSAFLMDLRSRNVIPIFLISCAYNPLSKHYDIDGDLQQRFMDFAKKYDITYFATNEILLENVNDERGLSRYFIDSCHMNKEGCRILAEKISQVLEEF